MGRLWQDIRYGLRMLIRSPGFTIVVVLTLALGIGTNAAVFGFLDRVLLRPLPVAKPDELVMVEFQTDHGGTDDSFNYPLYCAYRDQSEAFSGLAAYWGDAVEMGSGEVKSQVMGMAVSDNYFAVLGVRPVLGRTFTTEEEQVPGAHPVAVISHQFWQRHFDGSPAVLGQTIHVDGHPLTIVGVTPREFTGTVAGVGPSVYMPLGTWAYVKGFALEDRGYTWLHLLGRLKAGVTGEQTQANLRVLAEQIHAAEPLNTHTEILISDGSQGYNPWRQEGLWWPLALLQIPTMLVLVVACANVTNLLLARGTTRQREIAVRRALGASRRDVVRLLLCESVLLALLSGACAALLAQWLSYGLRNVLEVTRVLNTPVGVDGRILAVTLLGALASVLLFGLAPTLQVTKARAPQVLKEGSGIVAARSRWWSLRNLSVVTQVAVAMIVVTFGTLCARSLGRLRVADPGFDAARILGASVDFDGASIQGPQATQFFETVRERVATVPTVEAVCLAAEVPLASGRSKTGIKGSEFEIPPEQEWLSVDFGVIGPGYFRTLGIPVLRGRDFTIQDNVGAPRVMIVNETFAQRYWPGQDPISKQVTFADGTREVVGLVKAVKLISIREEPVPTVFWPLAQPMSRWFANIKPVMLVRAHGAPENLVQLVRREMESAGLGPVACDVRPLRDRAADQLSGQRTIAVILNVIGLVGLLFVVTGICGVVAYDVSRRTREIGVRVALGAGRRDVLVWVLCKGAILTGTGLILGIVLSIVPMWILSRLLPEIQAWDASFLYGVPMWDPLTYAGAALLLASAAAIACWLPARRAAKVDPMVALRYE